jgi:hypothetical protein
VADETRQTITSVHWVASVGSRWLLTHIEVWLLCVFEECRLHDVYGRVVFLNFRTYGPVGPIS